jgi:hypothetical protein
VSYDALTPWRFTDKKQRAHQMATEKHPAKVLAKLNSSDWSDLRRLEGTGDSKFWLYCIGANTGPRFMFNVTKLLLDDIESGSGKIAQIAMIINPLEGYLAAISEFDSETSLAEKLDFAEPMALAMTSFVVSQKSWKLVSMDKTNDEKHVLVLDWETALGPRCAQACFITDNGTMPGKEALIDVAMAIYSKHYGQKPKTIFDA